jgi:hypothetical protein
MRFWGDSAFGVGGTRKLRLRVPSPVARLACTENSVKSSAKKSREKKDLELS